MNRYVTTIVFFGALIGALNPATAQDWRSLVNGGAPVDEGAELSIEEQLAQLEEREATLRTRLASAQESASPDRAGQIGVSAQELRDRVRYLDEALNAVVRHQGVLEELAVLLDEAEQAAVNVDEITLPDPPPYSVRYGDTYRAEADVKELEFQSAQAELSLGRSAVADIAGRLAEAQATARQANEAAANATPGDRSRLTFLAALAQARVESLSAQHALRETFVRMAELRTARLEQEWQAAERRAAIAIENMDWRPQSLDAEWEEIYAGLDELKQRVVEAVDAEEEKLAAAIAAEEAARQALAENEDPGKAPELQSKVALRRVEHETAQRIVDLWNTRSSAVDAERQIWSLRRRVLSPIENTEVLTILEEGRNYRNLMEQWEQSWQLRQNAIRAEIVRLEQIVAGGTDPFLDDRRAELASLETRVNALTDAMLRVIDLQRRAKRLIEDARLRLDRLSWGERWEQIWTSVTGIWGEELFFEGENSITLGKIVSALIIVIVGIMLSRFLTRRLRATVVRRFNMDESATVTVERILFYSFVLITILWALRVVNIPLTVFTLFGGAIALGIGLGAQNMANNFLSGLILLADRPIKIGDIVEVDGQVGRIINIGGRCSTIKLFNGVDVLVPNSHMIEQKVVNWTLTDKRIRWDVTVGVAYGSSTREVSRLMMRAATEHGKVLEDPEPVVLFEEFGDSSLQFTVYFWVDMLTVMDMRIVRSDIRHQIDRLLRDAGITIAFPQRDVHFDAAKPIPVQVVEGNDPAMDADSGPEKGPSLP